MPRSLLRLRDVTARVGLSKATIYYLIKTGEFPASIKVLDAHSARWDSLAVDQWIAAVIARAAAQEETTKKCRKS